MISKAWLAVAAFFLALCMGLVPAVAATVTRTQSAGRGKATQSQPPTDFESGITDDDVPFDQGLRRLS